MIISRDGDSVEVKQGSHKTVRIKIVEDGEWSKIDLNRKQIQEFIEELQEQSKLIRDE